MNFLKKAARWLGVLIFVLALSSALFVNALTSFTEYENMKAIFSDVLSLQLENAAAQSDYRVESEELRQALLTQCIGKDELDVPIGELGEFGDVETITINCNELRQLPADEDVFEYLTGLLASNIFDSFYYTEYDCEFIECVQTGKYLVFLSQQGNQFFNSIKMAVWGAVAVGAVLIFAYSENWSHRLKGFGWPMVFTGASYFFVSFLKTGIVENFPLVIEARKSGIDVTRPINAIMAPVLNSLLFALVTGVVLLVAGYVLGHYEKMKGPEEKKVKTIRLKK